MNRQNRSVRRALIATATALLLGTVGALPAAANTGCAPAVITGHAASLVPESAVWDPAHHRFLLGSLRHGTVSAVRTDGSVRTLVDDPGTLLEVAGLRVDAARGRVLVTNLDNGLGERSSTATNGRIAGIGAYDLETGRRLFYVDLAAVAGDGGPHLANDIAIGPDGTAYVTDSFAPIVYRVGADGSASVLVHDDRLTPRPGGYGLNGIVHRDGRLVVGKWDDGTLWQIPLHHPADLRRVEVTGADGGALLHLDGLLGRPDGSIAGITNAFFGAGRDAEVELRSDDHWRTARLAAVRPSADPTPTAVTAGPGGSLYQLSGGLPDAFAGHPTDTFTLRRL
ncbi:SMP-30/gluconolactonase/LRE family protein [Streptomyces kaniharaensis]|uniref:SMP-30/gluconolactonase/LRE family protein n=1 Tax=Streptomyces kaniharaensis TaxID=212423 RepID=A0A6N7KQ38_9ACTN|nr:hypothetical protein [Streptomyces kaniharaensis]MQS11713.1 SMP-30/gluconolactonase/LRE family protein [Streptomyces kaniharaensis]